MKARFQLLSSLTFCLLILPISKNFSIDKNNLINLKSGVLLVGVCKEVVDYSLMPITEQNSLKKKFGEKYDVYIADVAKQKPFCSIYKSKRKNMVFVRSSSGSSFLINKEGFIVTNYHVVAQNKNIVVFDDAPGGITLRSAKIVWRSRKYDLVILKVKNLRSTRVPLSLANASVINLLINEDVWSLGFTGASNKGIAKALSLEVKTDKGVIRSKPEKRFLGSNTPVTTIEHSAFIHFGNSGGPLVDHCGRVLGVNQGGPKKVTGIGWAIHVDHLLEVLKNNNISYDLSVGPCDYYLENSSRAGSLLVYILIAILLLMIFAGTWLYRQRVARPVGLTQFVRREMSRYFKRDAKNESDIEIENNKVMVPLFATLTGIRSMDGSRFELRGDGEVVLGRSDVAGLHVASDSVGRLHARLGWCASTGSIWIEDLGSTNGTFLEQGRPLNSNEKTPLTSGLVFYLAEPEYAFKITTES